MILEGVWVAVITPFNEDGEINYSALKKHVRYLINSGVNGVYLCGSTAESFLLTLDERKRIVETVVNEVKSEINIVVHVGTISTNHSIQLANHAKDQGVSVVSMVPPFYYKFSPEEIKQHYKKVMESADVEMIIYNFPSLSNTNITDEIFYDLINHDKVIGIKHTSMNLYELERIKTCFNKRIMNGFDEVFLAGLVMGADGGISGTANVLVRQYVDIYNYYKKGDYEKAFDVQKKLNNVIGVIVKNGVMPSVKFIAEKFLNLGCLYTREPFSKLSTDQKQELVKAVEENNIFN